MAVEITLTPDGSQTFSTNIEGVTYKFKVSFNRRMNLWVASISQDSISLVNGIGLVGGVNILKQYPLSLDNIFIVNLDDSDIDASSDNLGISVKLFKLSQEEVDSIG